jgi:23S rRNA (guanine1835-N2)-methyltransferase
MAEQTFSVPQGSFQLSRADTEDLSLRAWDAADEYLLNHLARSDDPTPKRVLVINDGFGALAVALVESASEVVSWGDSFTAHECLARNLETNQINPSEVSTLSSVAGPEGKFDLVLFKVPKHNSLLEDQLHRLRPLLHEHSVVIAGGMVRHIHSSTLNLFEQILGPTKSSLATKKARLAFVEFDASLPAPINPWPLHWIHDGLKVTNRAGVFSARKLDIGTRLLLDNLDSGSGSVEVIDLGCGNGVVGAMFLAQNPAAHCLFVDESYAAVASASATVRDSGTDARARFDVGKRLDDLADQSSADLILNNPPFHDNAALSSAIANQMFQSSHRVLRSGGSLMVIGNRHLGYHLKLKRLFGNCETIDSNSKFVVLKADKQLRAG